MVAFENPEMAVVVLEDGSCNEAAMADVTPELLCRSDLIEIAKKSINRYEKICASDELPTEHIERAIAALTDTIGSLEQMLAIEKTTEVFVDKPKKPRYMYMTKGRKLVWAIPYTALH